MQNRIVELSFSWRKAWNLACNSGTSSQERPLVCLGLRRSWRHNSLLRVLATRLHILDAEQLGQKTTSEARYLKSDTSSMQQVPTCHRQARINKRKINESTKALTDVERAGLRPNQAVR